MVAVFVSVLMTVALLVLLIASLNVANMLLARASAREREVAVRIALGAGRGRLVRQMLAESVVLWLLGGGAGVLLAVGGARLLERFAPVIDGVPVRFAFDVDGGVLVVALLIALVTGAVFGLLPAVHAARRAVAPVLRAGGGAGDTRGRLRNGLVAAQLAFSVLLLVGAGLFLRALERGQGIDPGFRLDGIAVAPIQASRLGYTPEQEWAFYAQIADRLAAQPGVVGVGYTSLLPLGLSDAGIGIQVPGHEPPSGSEFISTSYHEVGGDYFGLMEMPVVRGRAFAASDRPGAPRVAVVNESFARRYWPTSEAVGRTFTVSGEAHTIVGVVRDARMRSLSDPPGPFLFLSAEQRRPAGTTMLVRTDGRTEGTAAIGNTHRHTVRALDPRVPVPAIQSLEAAVSVGLLPQRVAAAVTGVLGTTGLLLAALGLYGVVAYSVSRRTREIGVRMAIGATPGAVVLMVVRQSARLAAVGLVVGVGLALLAGQALAPFLLGVSAMDPVTLGAVPLVLAIVALGASWVPARRAARVGPAVALRSE
jgi:predicted permease